MSHPLDAFISESRRFLRDEYPAKLRRALADITEEDLWWRPNAACNSMGNLLLHLAGNLRQWVVHGLGGRADVRDRSSEFARKGGLSPEEALAALEKAVADADAVLAELDPAALLEPRTIQGMPTTGLAALYHVVEHFSMHTGQILQLVKIRRGRDLGFYSVDAQGKVTGTHW
ncbi:MAG TPA: DinB family protein [Longimicrobiales bacterium]|nr:DinB family protein [Longimicrobiales bacterium]